ncbi:MAG: nucleotidyl transferase AbiEii/AbiGii toxin family protein [Polyangia bacterium]|jgi:hypothetical protein|nr:nucleotidyl transferase AbiEii/AbiGii toxin family protein [Polyangia bacterium]
MKDEALALVEGVDDPSRALNLLREYVQVLVLRSLHESEAFANLAFVGGTALRFLENLPRFSEDLDFSLVEGEGYDPETWLRKVRRDLALDGFDVRVTFNAKKTVQVSWVRIAGLLAEAGLAGRKEQRLSIKLEIDTRPPKGAELSRTLVVRHMPLAIRHHRLSSLMAGKLHALITRRYAKGRDWFDLLWYRGHRPPIEPRLPLLQNALDQTQGQGRFDAARWSDLVRARLEKINVAALRHEVGPFLERPADAALLTADNLLSVLE